MREGMYLGHPPVNVGRARAAIVLQTMLRGASFYGGAAGLGAPLALPPLQGGIPRTASSPVRNPELVQLYPLTVAQAKLDLRRQFGIQGGAS